MKKLAALLLSLLMMLSAAQADMEWPETLTASQTHLQAYVTLANETLASLGAGEIDMRYELLNTFASLGMDGAALPEGYSPGFVLPVEMYFTMADEGLHKLELRMHDADRFASIAAACLHASSPVGVPLEQAQQIISGYVSRIKAAPTDSFEEDVVELQGASPRAYFAYYPNQFGDQYNWLQMTLIFPRPGSEGALLLSATPAPSSNDDMYEGYFAEDNYTHLEVFTTPTPEPDSAAMEP